MCYFSLAFHIKQRAGAVVIVCWDWHPVKDCFAFSLPVICSKAFDTEVPKILLEMLRWQFNWYFSGNRHTMSIWAE